MKTWEVLTFQIRCVGFTHAHTSHHVAGIFFFWFLLDVDIDNAFILGSFETVAGQRKQTKKQFREELATELISKCNMRQRGGRQSQDAILRLTQRHFPKCLGDLAQCKVCSKQHTHKCSHYGCEHCGNVIEINLQKTITFSKLHILCWG